MIFLDNEQTLQTHHHVNMWLYMAMVEHGSGMAWLQFIAARISGHHRRFAGHWYTVIAFAIGIDKTVVRTVQVQCMRHVMSVFQRYANAVSLLDAYGGGRQTQGTPRLVGFKVFHRHADQLRSKDPQPGHDARCDLVLGDRAARQGGSAIEFHDFEPDMDFVRVAISIEVTALLDSIGRQAALQQGGLRDIVGATNKGRNGKGVVCHAGL